MKKSKLIIKTLSALFAVIILFSSFAPISVFAQKVDEDIIFIPNQYMTTNMGFSLSGCQMVLQGDSVAFLVDSSDVEISADANPYVSQTPTNALCFTFQNLTEAQMLMLEYTYYDENNIKIVKYESIDILQQSGKITVTIFVGEGIADKISSYKLIISNAILGKFILYSVATVSVYEDSNEYIGNTLSMVYNDIADRINIQGTVNHDVMIANQGAVIELYCIPAGEDNSFVMLDESVPYATTALSIRFEFDVPLKELWDRYNKFAIILRKTNGEKLLVDSCKYLGSVEDTSISDKETETYNSFKGIETIFTASATEAGVGTAVVDVYLDKLQNTQNTGYFYSVEGKNFYFDRAYILSIDKQVKALYGTGSKVYLRFLVSNENRTGPYTTLLDNSTVNFRAVIIDNPTARQNIHVFTDYLASRYSGNDYGKINGIVLGKSIDNAVVQNYAYNMPMCEYAKLYSEYFATVALTAKKAIPDIEMIIPVSNNINNSLNSDLRDNNYNRELLLDSIVKILSGSGGEKLFTFTPMLESVQNPFELKNITIIGEGEEADRTITEINRYNADSSFITAHNIHVFENLLSDIIKDNNICREAYIFLWEPDKDIAANHLEAFYAYTFYTLLFDSNSKCFITSFNSAEKAGVLDKISKLKYMMKYIDTEKNTKVTSHIPELLGFASWSSEITNFYANFASLRILYENEFTYEAPNDITGSFSLWNFGEATGSAGWFPSSYCESIALNVTNEYPQNLMCAVNTKGSIPGEYASVSYVYEFPETLTYAKYLSIDAAVEDNGIENTLFEIKAIINGENVTVEAKRTITKGGRISLIIDLSQTQPLTKAEHFTISIKEITGKSSEFKLHIFDISIHSNSYNNEDFANLINEERNRIKAEIIGEETNTVQSSKLWIVILLIGIMSTGIVVALMIRSDKKRI